MKIIEKYENGLVLIECFSHKDDRGEFVKQYNDDQFRNWGLDFQPKESVFSISQKDVVRGMHFQRPPHSHAKLVTCGAGAILDVVVDIRVGSADYGKVFGFELSEDNRHALLIPAGFAHGFLGLEDRNLVIYSTDSVYANASDDGILWNAIDFDWPVSSPIVSEKDQELTALADYHSPFKAD